MKTQQIEVVPLKTQFLTISRIDINILYFVCTVGGFGSGLGFVRLLQNVQTPRRESTAVGPAFPLDCIKRIVVVHQQ